MEVENMEKAKNRLTCACVWQSEEDRMQSKYLKMRPVEQMEIQILVCGFMYLFMKEINHGSTMGSEDQLSGCRGGIALCMRVHAFKILCVRAYLYLYWTTFTIWCVYVYII